MTTDRCAHSGTDAVRGEPQVGDNEGENDETQPPDAVEMVPSPAFKKRRGRPPGSEKKKRRDSAEQETVDALRG